MRRFFEEHKLDTEDLSENRVKNIKASVLARIEEDKPMKKRFKFKPLVIAAAMIATAAASAIVTSAAGNGQPTYLITINGNRVPWSVETVEEDIQYTMPSGETIAAHKTEELVTYEIPEEFVVPGGNRKVTKVKGEITAAESGNQLMVYGETRVGADKLPNVFCKSSRGNTNWFTNTTTIDIEYEFLDFDFLIDNADQQSVRSVSG